MLWRKTEARKIQVNLEDGGGKEGKKEQAKEKLVKRLRIALK